MSTGGHSCAEDITDSHITCHGFCNAIFHPQCCGIAQSAFDEVFRNKQIFWLCRSCANLMSDIRLRRSVRSAHEAGQEKLLGAHNEIVDNLKSEIMVELKKEIRSNFAALINSSSMTPRSSKYCASAAASVQTRRLFGKPAASKPPEQPLVCGTAESLSPSFNNFVADAPSQKFWLYLSRIARNVTVEQVRALATQRLGTNDVEVVRLVANGRDVNSLSFISFKLGLNADFKAKALSAASWPKGLFFREFKDNRSSGNFWKPQRTSNRGSPFENGQSVNARSSPEEATMVE